MINFGFSGMLVTPKIAALGSLFLLLFSGLSLASPYSSSEVRDDQNQHPLTSSPLVEGWHNFSVGFSLQSSYGAAAVIFTWPDGRLETHTTVFYGGPEYNEVMARLSLASSQHLAYCGPIQALSENLSVLLIMYPIVGLHTMTTANIGQISPAKQQEQL
jgi:hypothetical protein